MNELWSSKLGELITQYDDLIEEEYKPRLKKPSREDQAAIKALLSPKINQKLVFHVVQLLNEAANQLDKLTIRWVKAHVDDSALHRGNAFAEVHWGCNHYEFGRGVVISCDFQQTSNTT